MQGLNYINKSWQCFDRSFRRMYWTDIGPHPRIERANLDGSEREVLVDETHESDTGPREKENLLGR